MIASQAPQRFLSVFKLAVLNVAVIVGLRTLPMLAAEGCSLFFFCIAASVIFFIPTALVSAELATGWPQDRGIFFWVSRALGERWGFVAIWLQWVHNLVGYPAYLSFAAATFAHLFNPAVAEHKLYMLVFILFVYWSAVAANLLGLRASSFISTIGVVVGTFFPALVFIVLGFLWLVFVGHGNFSCSWCALLPSFCDMKSMVTLAVLPLSFAGIEVSAVHAQEVKDPQRNFPRAIFLTIGLVVGMFIFGSLAIALVLPSNSISLVSGVMQAFSSFFVAYHMEWAIPVIAVCILVGFLGAVTTWVAGPSKGMYFAAVRGCLPPFFQKKNSHGSAVAILLVQGTIVALFSSVFLFMPTATNSFWVLLTLAIQLYFLMYVLMFISAIVLRYTEPSVVRPYRVPGGNIGMWLLAGVGIVGSLVAFFVAFFQSRHSSGVDTVRYILFLAACNIVMFAIPLIIYSLRKPSWKQSLK
jgi:amino acid transporter